MHDTHRLRGHWYERQACNSHAGDHDIRPQLLQTQYLAILLGAPLCVIVARICLCFGLRNMCCLRRPEHDFCDAKCPKPSPKEDTVYVTVVRVTAFTRLLYRRVKERRTLQRSKRVSTKLEGLKYMQQLRPIDCSQKATNAKQGKMNCSKK